MKINSITLTNYRLYKGVNQILFDTTDKKNIFLICGQNGFGKTTFLHSLLWCLYGRLMVDIDDSIRKDVNLRGGYAALLQTNLNNVTRQQLEEYIERNGVNKKDSIMQSLCCYSVSIDFTDVMIPSIPCKSLLVTRSYNVVSKREKLEIKIDGVPNELTTEIGNDIFINDFILNKDIARFFFFDSERIVALAETSTIEEKRKLNSAYTEVLGVKKYEDLRNNLDNLRLRFRKKSSDIKSREKLIDLLAKQDSYQKSILDLENQIKENEERLVILKKENEEFQMRLFREGNTTSIEELKRLERVVEQTKKLDIEYKSKLKNFLDFAPFAICGGLFQKTKVQLEHDYNIHKSNQNVVNQNILISDIANDLYSMIDHISLDMNVSFDLQQQVQGILKKYEIQENSEKQLISIDKNDFQEFISIYNNVTSTYKTEFKRLTEDYRKNKQTLERNSRRISNMQTKENDSLIKSIRQQKNVIVESINGCDENIRSCYEQSGNLKREITTINKQISELRKKVSLDDSDVKKDKLAEALVNELDSFLQSLKRDKKSSLETRIKNILNSLMHKEDFVGSVKVNIVEDCLDIDLYTLEHDLIRKDSLSKGEQQLYATSLLKALVEESGIEFPVFIDSPLQKFDKSHSHKIITEFYPTISKQVILFPLLHKELTTDELDVMKPLISASYFIENDNAQSCFKKVDVNQLMNL